ncbi:MAG: hypothetical protein IT325_08455 [Anaerolineae bacterium]|nr:hypothetical protein [Anaerolineae bacterium]
MAKLVLLITSKIEKGLQVAVAWEEAGAPGVTLIDTHGLHSLRQKSKSLELPFIVSLASVLRQTEESNQTLLSVVPDELVDTLIEAASTILGNLNSPGSGIAFVLPVDRIEGLGPIRPKKPKA